MNKPVFWHCAWVSPVDEKKIQNLRISDRPKPARDTSVKIQLEFRVQSAHIEIRLQSTQRLRRKYLLYVRLICD